MVLIARQELLTQLSEAPVVQAFAGYLLLDIVPREIPGSNERDRITIAALRSIAVAERSIFESAYSEIRRRQITDQADWIFDDYLMFALLTAALRFSANLEFVQKVLETRRTVQSGIEAGITDDLLHLAKQHRVDPPSPVVFVGCHFAGQVPADEKALKTVYRTATRLLSQHHGDFLSIISLAAIDIVVASSPLLPEVPSLFWREFNRRITFLASGIHTFISIVISAAWLAAVLYYLVSDSRWFEKLFTTGLLVFPAAFLWQRKRIVAATRQLILRISGGPIFSRKM